MSRNPSLTKKNAACLREEPRPRRREPGRDGACCDVRADASRLLARAEAEKKQVARVIHDELGQKLTAISLELSLWQTELDSGRSKSVKAVREKIAVLGELVKGLILSTRQVATTLRPRVLDEFGLSAALEWHLEKVQKMTGVKCRFTTNGEKLDMERFAAAQTFRIVEEIVELQVGAGCRRLHLRVIAQDDALALVFEDCSAERQLSPEILARVRLLGGQIQIGDNDRPIVVALPARPGETLLHQATF